MTTKLDTSALWQLLSDKQLPANVRQSLGHVAAARQVRQSLRNVQQSPHKLHESMTALQHIFLLRGYFKKQAKKKARAAADSAAHRWRYQVTDNLKITGSFSSLIACISIIYPQIIEGKENAVRALYYGHMVADPRHHGCHLLGAATPVELVLFAPQPRVRPELLQMLLNFVASH